MLTSSWAFPSMRKGSDSTRISKDFSIMLDAVMTRCALR